MLDLLETWEREIGESGAKGYAKYLMTVHRICLRMFGRTQSQRFPAVAG